MKPKKTKEAQKPAKDPVPEWMADDIKAKAKKLNLNERLAKAEELERVASQLRDFAKPPVEFVCQAKTQLRPKVKEAVILFADFHGGAGKDEDEKISLGIRWVLEAALPKMEELTRAVNLKCRYNLAEDVSSSNHDEDLIAAAIEKYKAARAAAKEERDDED